MLIFVTGICDDTFLFSFFFCDNNKNKEGQLSKIERKWVSLSIELLAKERKYLLNINQELLQLF